MSVRFRKQTSQNIKRQLSDLKADIIFTSKAVWGT
ncbi:hypothetical protein CPS_0793 [Colwellia psychrerythraea 34H]|uniref:Uncharacterized protein n=1 Tax=Colwellia psychrerythraea (strain 34H / ATCC BAA-681) TaxID=167879 RepID=Q488H3_COLP3|nr:hypothetical protein CPS_0793 [Colwellia psychrerythraea 34H]